MFELEGAAEIGNITVSRRFYPEKRTRSEHEIAARQKGFKTASPEAGCELGDKNTSASRQGNRGQSEGQRRESKRATKKGAIAFSGREN